MNQAQRNKLAARVLEGAFRQSRRIVVETVETYPLLKEYDPFLHDLDRGRPHSASSLNDLIDSVEQTRKRLPSKIKDITKLQAACNDKATVEKARKAINKKIEIAIKKGSKGEYIRTPSFTDELFIAFDDRTVDKMNKALKEKINKEYELFGKRIIKMVEAAKVVYDTAQFDDDAAEVLKAVNKFADTKF